MHSEKIRRLKSTCYNMITGINQSKFDGRKCNSDQKWNNEKSRCECKNRREHHVCEKDYTWNPATGSCKNGKYLERLLMIQ